MSILHQPDPSRKPPRLRLPRYDLKRNVPAPDSTWDEYSPIKTTPTLFSPQSPRFQDFYNAHRIERSPEKAIPSLSLNVGEKEPFFLEKEQIITEPKFIPNDPNTNNKTDVDKNKEENKKKNKEKEEIPKPKFIEEPNFASYVKEKSESTNQENILFLPKEFENVRLVYRPFGCFGMDRKAQKEKKRAKRELEKQKRNAAKDDSLK